MSLAWASGLVSARTSSLRLAALAAAGSRSLSESAGSGASGRRKRSPVAFQETLGKLRDEGRLSEHDYLAQVSRARRAQIPARRAEGQRIKELVAREKAEEALELESVFDFSDAGAEARNELEAKLEATNSMSLWELTQFEREEDEKREAMMKEMENQRLESVEEVTLTDQETLPSTDVWNRQRHLGEAVSRSLQLALLKDREDLQNISVPYAPIEDDEIIRFETIDSVYAGPRNPFPQARRVKMSVYVKDLKLPEWAAHKLKVRWSF